MNDMKRIVSMMVCLIAFASLQAQRIKTGDKWWDGNMLYTAQEVNGGYGIDLNGVDDKGNASTIVLMKSDGAGEYRVFTRGDAIALRINELDKVRYIRQEGMNFLAFFNGRGDAAWIMVLTPDNLQNCVNQQRWAEQQSVSNMLTSMLMNTTYLARFPKSDLRLMRNEILARHGWRFESKDLQEYFGKQWWYKPGNDNNAIKLTIIEQANIQMLKSEEATPEEHRTPLLSAEQFVGGLAEDGRDPEELAGEKVFTVKSEEEFLAALGPQRTIIIGRNVHLNLSAVLENERLFTAPGRRWSSDAMAFSGQEPLIISESVFDGHQLVLANMSQLVIKGAGNSSIEVNPRYSFCLSFINCDHCDIENLTIGHTESGYCMGGVIGIKGGSQNMVKDCDLYGCGTYGFSLTDTQDFGAIACRVHDCTYGIMELRSSTAIRFNTCDFYRNKEYDLVESHGCNGVSFSDCRFYANSGDSKLFNFDTEFYLFGCEIYHPTENLGTIKLADMRDMKLSPNPYDLNIKKRSIGADVNR